MPRPTKRQKQYSLENGKPENRQPFRIQLAFKQILGFGSPIRECRARIVDKTSSDVSGVSTTASAEKGKKIFEVAVNELVKHVELLKKTVVKDLIHNSKV